MNKIYSNILSFVESDYSDFSITNMNQKKFTIEKNSEKITLSSQDFSIIDTSEKFTSKTSLVRRFLKVK